MEDITIKQKRFLQELITYIDREKRPPTNRELREVMQLKSPRSVGQYLDSLENAGFIKRGRGSRNIQIIRKLSDVEENPKTIEIPILGVAACGAPLLAEENIESYVDISEKIVRRPYNYFILKAKGNSMDMVNIKDDDLVLVRQQPTAEDGEIVVALIDDKATIKKIKYFSDHIKLEPRSSSLDNKTIILERDFQIQGVVVKTL